MGGKLTEAANGRESERHEVLDDEEHEESDHVERPDEEAASS